MSRSLTHEQLRDAAAAAQIGIRALQAVIAVESAGGGFLEDGRPKILLEGHVLWKRLEGRGIDPRALAAAHPDLCYPVWTRAHYRGGAGEWDRLNTVIAYAQHHVPALVESYQKAAEEAASWGLFQIMGENYAPAGYPDVTRYVAAMKVDEATQLHAALSFMRHSGCLPFLQLRNWTAFARAYNGPGQVADYAGRLETAFRKAHG